MTLFNTVLEMLIPVLAGFVAVKTKLITDDFSKMLSRLVLYVAQPFLLASALMGVEYSDQNLKSGLLILLVSLIAHAVPAALAFLTTRPIKNAEEGRVSEFCMVFANVGFFGFPLLEAVYGDIGLFWGGFFIIMFNVLMWSYGVFTLARAKKSMKIGVRKIFLNAGTIPCLLGFAVWLMRFDVYPPIYTSMLRIGNSCTPLSMIIIGIMIARLPLKKLVLAPLPYLTTLVKLVVFPVIVGVVLKLCGFSEEMAVFGALMTALPTASGAAMFAETNDVAPTLAAQTVGVTTILSIATVPLIMQLVTFILERI